MNTYEFDGEKYKKASKHQKQWGDSLIGELSLNGNEAILDLGCGDSRVTEELANLVPAGSVLGIDASEGMIASARSREKDNLQFTRMDINDMNFHTMFDVIFSNAALHWVKDHKKLVKNTFPALKPGGMILWDFAGDGNCANFFETCQHKIQSEKYRSWFTDFEWPWYMPAKADYEKIFANSDFSSFVITEVVRDTYFSDAGEMIKWIDQPSIVPFVSILPDGIREEFRQDVIDEMLEKTLQPDGRCFESFRRIHVTARK